MEAVNGSKSNIKLVYIVAGIAAFLFAAAVIIYKVNAPEFSTPKMIVWIALAWIIIAGGAGGFHYYTRRQKTKIIEEQIADKLPPAITKAQARLHALKLLRDEPFSDYIRDVEVESTGLFGKSKRSSIYTLIGKGQYSANTKYCIIINQHFPEEKSTVLLNATAPQISRYQNIAAVDPEDEPVVEERIDRDLATGKETTYRKLASAERKADSDKKEDDL